MKTDRKDIFEHEENLIYDFRLGTTWELTKMKY